MKIIIGLIISFMSTFIILLYLVHQVLVNFNFCLYTTLCEKYNFMMLRCINQCPFWRFLILSSRQFWVDQSLSFSAGPPQFTRTPIDQIGVQGGVASFVCQAKGDPQPKITWSRKGKKVTNQRFEVNTPQLNKHKPYRQLAYTFAASSDTRL